MNDARPQRAALAATVLATSMTFIDATALNQALPAIGGALDASTAQLLWTVGAYALPMALLLLPAGAVADRFGRRATLAVGVGVFALASAACAAAPSAAALIAARAAQGAGGALVVPASLAVLAGAHAPAQRGRAIGVWSAWCAAATVAGPLLGGALAQAGWWRAIFLVNVPLAGVALVCLRGVGGAREVRGVGERPMARASVRSSEGRRGALAALVPASLRRSAVVRAAAGSTLLLYTAMYGLLLVLPLALIAGTGYRADHAAAAQMPMVLALIGVAPLAGRWMDRHGPRGPVCGACALAAFGLLWLCVGGVGDGPAAYGGRVLMPLLLLGAGLGLAIVPLSTTVMNEAGQGALGAGAALNALLARMAAAVAVGLFGGVMLMYGVDPGASGELGAAGWSGAFRGAMVAAGVLCALAAALAGRWLPGRVGAAWASSP